MERFSNPHIKDKVTRLALDGSLKFMNSIQEPLQDMLHADPSTVPDNVALALV